MCFQSTDEIDGMLNTLSDPLPLCLSEQRVILCCDADVVSPQRFLPASGPVRFFYSGTKPIMHCRGHAHTLRREIRKDTFFSGVDDSAAAALHSQPNARVNSCFLYACIAVCFGPGLLDSDPCWFFILAI